MKPLERSIGDKPLKHFKAKHIDFLSKTEVDNAISLLEATRRIGWSSATLPASALLEVMIDSALQLAELAREHGPWSPPSNAELEFLDKPVTNRRSGGTGKMREITSDSLGNPSQRRKGPYQDLVEDPQFVPYFQELATELSQIARTHQPPANLHGKAGQDRYEHNPQQRTQEVPRYYKDRRAADKARHEWRTKGKISPAGYWYYRRQHGKRHRRNDHQTKPVKG